MRAPTHGGHRPHHPGARCIGAQMPRPQLVSPTGILVRSANREPEATKAWPPARVSQAARWCFTTATPTGACRSRDTTWHFTIRRKKTSRGALLRDS